MAMQFWVWGGGVAVFGREDQKARLAVSDVATPVRLWLACERHLLSAKYQLTN